MAMAPLAKQDDTAWIAGTCQNKDNNNGDAESWLSHFIQEPVQIKIESRGSH